MSPSKPSTSSGSAESGKRTVYRWTQELIRQRLGEGKPFRMKSGGVYVMHPSGAFVRMDKDRRPVKERKRARREARQKETA